MTRNEAQLKRMKYASMMRERGTPLHITPEELAELTVHIRRLWNRGMSAQGIADTAPVFVLDTTVGKIVRGERGTVHRDTYNALMRTFYVPPTGRKTGRHMDSTGVRRRVQALVADGFGYRCLGGIMGVTLQAVYGMATREATVYASTYGYVVPVYEKLQGKDPRAYGASEVGVKRALTTARKNLWAPSHTWDPDTIDDPDAFPEWTGVCGTVQGYNMHREHKIHVRPFQYGDNKTRYQVMCRPCVDARMDRKGELEAIRRGRNEQAREWLREGKAYTWVALELGVSSRTIERIASKMREAGEL